MKRCWLTANLLVFSPLKSSAHARLAYKPEMSSSTLACVGGARRVVTITVSSLADESILPESPDVGIVRCQWGHPASLQKVRAKFPHLTYRPSEHPGNTDPCIEFFLVTTMPELCRAVCRVVEQVTVERKNAIHVLCPHGKHKSAATALGSACVLASLGFDCTIRYSRLQRLPHHYGGRYAFYRTTVQSGQALKDMKDSTAVLTQFTTRLQKGITSPTGRGIAADDFDVRPSGRIVAVHDSTACGHHVADMSGDEASDEVDDATEESESGAESADVPGASVKEEQTEVTNGTPFPDFAPAIGLEDPPSSAGGSLRLPPGLSLDEPNAEEMLRRGHAVSYAGLGQSAGDDDGQGARVMAVPSSTTLATEHMVRKVLQDWMRQDAKTSLPVLRRRGQASRPIDVSPGAMGEHSAITVLRWLSGRVLQAAPGCLSEGKQNRGRGQTEIERARRAAMESHALIQSSPDLSDWWLFDEMPSDPQETAGGVVLSDMTWLKRLGDAHRGELVLLPPSPKDRPWRWRTREELRGEFGLIVGPRDDVAAELAKIFPFDKEQYAWGKAGDHDDYHITLTDAHRDEPWRPEVGNTQPCRVVARDRLSKWHGTGAWILDGDAQVTSLPQAFYLAGKRWTAAQIYDCYLNCPIYAQKHDRLGDGAAWAKRRRIQAAVKADELKEACDTAQLLLKRYVGVFQHSPRSLRRVAKHVRAALQAGAQALLCSDTSKPSGAGTVQFVPHDVLPQEMVKCMTGLPPGGKAVCKVMLYCAALKKVHLADGSEAVKNCGRLAADVSARYNLQVGEKVLSSFYCAECTRTLRDLGSAKDLGPRLLYVWWVGMPAGPIQVLLQGIGKDDAMPGDDMQHEPGVTVRIGKDDASQESICSHGPGDSTVRFRVKPPLSQQIWRRLRQQTS